MAGYSGTPLARKLGLQPQTRLVVLTPPREYRALVGELPPGASLSARLGADARFIHLFTRSRRDLATRFPRLSRALADDGMLWISWPKRSAGVATDLTEDIVRALGLAVGLVDVKVCAVDEVWSGLKFVRRLRDRKRRR